MSRAVVAIALLASSCGRPAPDRTVEIEALDLPPRFEPAEVHVDAGDTVGFVVVNAGDVPHEWVLGDRAVQEARARNARQPEPLAVIELESPQTSGRTVVTFEEPGRLIFGCHESDHYAQGMAGVVIIQ